MTRRKFERLLSDWMDEPHNAGLAQALAAAAEADPRLARVRDEWLRLDALLRAYRAENERVDWQHFRQHVGSSVGAAGGPADGASVGEGLDAALRASTDLPEGVDWPGLRATISRRVHAERRRARAGRRLVPHALALAAAVLLAVILPQLRLTAPPLPRSIADSAAADSAGRVTAEIVAPHGDRRLRAIRSDGDRNTGRVYATVTRLDGAALGEPENRTAAESGAVDGDRPAGAAPMSFVLIDASGEATADALDG